MLRSLPYYWDNLRRQSLGQIAWRVRNRLLLGRLVDPALARRGSRGAPRAWMQSAHERPGEFLDQMQHLSRTHSFLRCDLPALTAAVEQQAAGEVHDWIGVAKAVCAGRYPIVGENAPALGLPPRDWHVNPSDDHEWLHALHRFRLIAPALAMARAYTGERSYSDAFALIVDDWIARNPRGTSVAWAAMGTSIRLHGWLWAYKLLLGAGALAPEFHTRFLSSMALQAEHLSRRLEKDLLENHLIYNYFALFLAGLTLPIADRAARWQRIGHAGLLTELERQFYPDGMHAEQASHYHVEMTLLYAEWLLLCRSASLAVPRWAEERVEAAIGACLLFWKPNGSFFLLSDAFYSYLSWDAAADVRTCLLLGAALFDRSEWTAELDRPSAWACWMLGARVTELWGRRGTARLNCEPSVRQAGGYVAVRSGAAQTSELLLIDGGPFALAHCAGHGHSDSLAVVWHVAGNDLLTDPGVLSYQPGPETMPLKRTSAHNTLSVDGADHAYLWRFTRWCYLPEVHICAAQRRGAGFYFEGTQTGYRRLPRPVLHRRRIWYVPGQALLVADTLEGAGPHAVGIHWQFAEKVQVEISDEAVHFTAGALRGTLRVSAGAEALSAVRRAAVLAPDYGVRRAGTCCDFAGTWQADEVFESLFVLDGAPRTTATEIRARVDAATQEPAAAV